MKYLIKFPSRSRPDRFKEALDSYVKHASDLTQIHFLFSFDEDDLYLPQYLKIVENAPVKSRTYIGTSLGKVHAINRDLNEFLNEIGQQKFDIIILASDDFVVVQPFQDIINDKAKEHGLDRVFWFHDNNQGRLNTYSVLGIKYYLRFNYLYNPQYASLFCDNEFHEVAVRDGKMNIEPYPCIAEHRHPMLNKLYKTDELYRKNESFWNQDQELYHARKARNFTN